MEERGEFPPSAILVPFLCPWMRHACHRVCMPHTHGFRAKRSGAFCWQLLCTGAQGPQQSQEEARAVLTACESHKLFLAVFFPSWPAGPQRPEAPGP